MRLIVVALSFFICAASALAAERLPAGFVASDLNGSRGPVAQGDEVAFEIVPKGCGDADYGNGSGESDCSNGNVKNVMRYKTEAKLGQAVEYRFDILVDPAISYKGYPQGEVYPFGGDGYDSRLRVAYWEGPARKNFIADLKLDARHGLAFRFKQCQSPADFGKWVTFSMKVKWAGDESGWIVVRCDDRVIYEGEGVVTNESTTCYLSNECDPSKPKKNAKRVLWHLGLSMNGWGPNWKELSGPTIGAFTAFDEAGIRIKMRNISVTQGAELYTEADRELVRQLQARLNELGCDVGTPDGIAGRKTRAAALSCRPLEELPAGLTVSTVSVFLEKYKAAS